MHVWMKRHFNTAGHYCCYCCRSLSSNQLTGTLPAKWANAFDLSFVYVICVAGFPWRCWLYVQRHIYLCACPQVRVVDWRTHLTVCVRLHYRCSYLDDNMLSGSLPASWGFLTDLTYLYVNYVCSSVCLVAGSVHSGRWECVSVHRVVTVASAGTWTITS